MHGCGIGWVGEWGNQQTAGFFSFLREIGSWDPTGSETGGGSFFAFDQSMEVLEPDFCKDKYSPRWGVVDLPVSEHSAFSLHNHRNHFLVCLWIFCAVAHASFWKQIVDPHNNNNKAWVNWHTSLFWTINVRFPTVILSLAGKRVYTLCPTHVMWQKKHFWCRYTEQLS